MRRNSGVCAHRALCQQLVEGRCNAGGAIGVQSESAPLQAYEAITLSNAPLTRMHTTVSHHHHIINQYRFTCQIYLDQGLNCPHSSRVVNGLTDSLFFIPMPRQGVLWVVGMWGRALQLALSWAGSKSTRKNPTCKTKTPR